MTDSEFLEHLQSLAQSTPPPLRIRLSGEDTDRLLRLCADNRESRRLTSTPRQFTRRELNNCIKVINESAAARVAHQLVHGKAPRSKLDTSMIRNNFFKAYGGLRWSDEDVAKIARPLMTVHDEVSYLRPVSKDLLKKFITK
jgi:hypothetical protein